MSDKYEPSARSWIDAQQAIQQLDRDITLAIRIANPGMDQAAGLALWRKEVDAISSRVIGNRSRQGKITNSDLKLLAEATFRRCLEILEGPAREAAESDHDAKL